MQVVSYVPGLNPTPGYSNPQTALGSPERFTGEGVFPGAVTPFNSAFGADELVSIGEGGELVLKFGQAVTDNPLNPFGMDLLIFGNAFYFDLSFPAGVAGPLASEGGMVSVSADGVSWFDVPNVQADGRYPTLGYLDLASAYEPLPGLVPSDFTRPVDPSFDPSGKTFEEIVSGYAGSGGGAGVDIASVGLSEIWFVRISNPMGSGVTPEIDAVSIVAVPSPGVAVAMVVGLVCSVGPRRR